MIKNLAFCANSYDTHTYMSNLSYYINDSIEKIWVFKENHSEKELEYLLGRTKYGYIENCSDYFDLVIGINNPAHFCLKFNSPLDIKFNYNMFDVHSNHSNSVWKELSNTPKPIVLILYAGKFASARTTLSPCPMALSV